VGSDYFATATHYSFLASRIVAALRAGGRFVLITGDPPAGSHPLCKALRRTTASRAVIAIPCGSGLSADELSRAGSVVTAVPASSAAMAPPLFVFDNVDQLSGEQITKVCEFIQQGVRKEVGVFLACPSFVARLEEPTLQFLKQTIAGQFCFWDIGEEERIEFLRYRLTRGRRSCKARGHPRGIFRPFAALSIIAAAIIAMVGVGAFLGLQYIKVAAELIEHARTGTASPREALPRPSLPSVADATTALPADATEPVSSTPPAAPSQLREGRPTDVLPPAHEPAMLEAPPPPAQPALARTVPLPDLTPQPAVQPAVAPPAPAPEATSHMTSHLSTQLSPGRQLPPAAIAALVSRGDSFLRAGDVASARLFYERAADAGEALAALRLSATFDPDFLGRAGIRGALGDPTEARSWYHRARQLQDDTAERPKEPGQQGLEESASSAH
jgi:hypothetical protein